MKTTRRTEIVFERERTIIYGQRHPREKAWCHPCAADVEMITIFEAARLIGVSSYTIHTQINEGQLHGWTNDLGVWFVCPGSLG